MQLTTPLAYVLALATASCAFAPAAFLSKSMSPTSNSNGISNSALFISSWGTKGSPYMNRDAKDAKVEDPEAKIQSYLPTPDSVEARSNLVETNVLVSGLVRSRERTDQTVFDLLNDEEAAFDFTRIVAFCDDVKFAKKRLLSRSARYTGLLDKLDFEQADTEGALPTVAQLDDHKITSWLAHLDASQEEQADVEDFLLSRTKQIADLAKQASDVKNVAILWVGANGLENIKATKEAIESLSTAELDFSVVAVGKLHESPEGKMPYQFQPLGETEQSILNETQVFSRHESLRMVTECLQLSAGIGKAFSCMEVNDVNATEAKLIKGLREAGYTRPQEIDHMIRDGAANYQKAIDEYREANPNARGTSDLWWEQPEYALKQASFEEQELMRKQDQKSKTNAEVEQIAREWAKREFFKKSMDGSMEEKVSEEDFIKSVWDRALFEGDLKYRQMKGEGAPSEEDATRELMEFKSKQAIKEETMLKKAKAELAELLDDDDDAIVTVEAKIVKDDDDDE